MIIKKNVSIDFFVYGYNIIVEFYWFGNIYYIDIYYLSGKFIIVEFKLFIKVFM